MMSKLYKLVVLLTLVGLSIILSSAIATLQFIYQKRSAQLKEHLTAEYKKLQKQKTKGHQSSSKSSSSSSSNKSKQKNDTNHQQQSQQHTNREANPLHPNELNIKQQYTSSSSSSTALIAESHLGLALRDIPFEVHTSNHYDLVGAHGSNDVSVRDSVAGMISGNGSGSGNGNGNSNSNDGSDGNGYGADSGGGSGYSTRFGGTAIPARLRYGAIVPDGDLTHVDHYNDHDYGGSISSSGSSVNKVKSTANGEPASSKSNSNGNVKRIDDDDYADDDYADDDDEFDMDEENEIPIPPLVMGGTKRNGVEFVKLENPILASNGNYHKNKHEQQRRQQSKLGVGSKTASFLSSLFTVSSSSSSSTRRKRSKSKPDDNYSTTGNDHDDNNNSNNKHHSHRHNPYLREQSALYHLQKASDYGNPYAQNMIANSLASGILPIQNYPSLRSYLNITLDVPSDFAPTSEYNKKKNKKNSDINDNENHNDNDNSSDSAHAQQLTKAILLWHMSAMEGNIESMMALGYRHYISATSRSNSMQNILVHDSDLRAVEGDHYRRQMNTNMNANADVNVNGDMNNNGGTNNNMNMNIGTKNTSPVRHSPQETDHYGVLGTCESSLAYYEEAVNHIMDDLESGPLRGKVTPAQDTHTLPEIRQRGSSSALSNNNKPDELEEAIKFMELRATRKHDPDLHSAYKLATMYHYGLRGVKQDMRLALKYYEIGAAHNNWECAGQAGKFYLFGMGMEDDERDFKKAYKYFKVAAPGGITGCEERFVKKQVNTHEDKNDEEDYEGDDDDFEEDLFSYLEKKVYQCDHPAVNGMGLLHVFGVPSMVKPNLKTAVRYFELAAKLGNMDAMYNLAMLRLGWMNPYYDDLFSRSGNTSLNKNLKRIGPSTSSFLEATGLLSKSAEMGHLQAKHRLGMIYSKGFKVGDTLTVRAECKKALSIFKGVATTVGTTVTKRMRAAYKQYTAGDYESSLRNYLAAAETGSIEAQVNAAFLLEEGYCLGLNHLQCMKASVRLWRAAARMGHEEACLRVGDFYFYGRLREDVDFDDKNSLVAQRDIEFALSPLPWARYILYPEDLIPKARKAMIKSIRWLLENRKSPPISEVCDGTDKTCVNIAETSPETKDTFSKEQKEHFKIAAKYYRTAAVEMQSARANFNLGFMHEWGLGLTQDFPLAKRYYDLAADAAENSGDGVLANQIALVCMRIHESVVKAKSSFRAWLEEQEMKSDVKSSTSPPLLVDNLQSATTRTGVILYHILTWESALIFALILILTGLIQHRYTRHHQ